VRARLALGREQVALRDVELVRGGGDHRQIGVVEIGEQRNRRES
jgi:hypothetical protein